MRMRTVLGIVCLLIAAAALGYLAVGWGTTIWAQGLTASLTDQTTQPTFPATVGGLATATISLLAGIALLKARERA
jgi:hypothetical protein